MKKIKSKMETIKLLKKEKFFLQVKTNIVENLLKLGIKIDYALPFILSSIIALTIENTTTPPYIIEPTSSKESSNTELDKLDNHSFIYSTPWQYNEQNVLERTEITFALNSEIDLKNAESILKMNEEELKMSFKVQNYQTFKAVSSKDIDPTYEEEMIIIPSIMVDGENKLIRSTIKKEYVTNTLLYLVVSFAAGLLFKNVEDALTHTYIRDNLKERLINIRESHSEELIKLNNSIKEQYEKKESKKISFKKKYNNV